jgi:hypothetical protein
LIGRYLGSKAISKMDRPEAVLSRSRRSQDRKTGDTVAAGLGREVGSA